MPMTSATLRYLLPFTLEKRSVQGNALQNLDLAVPAEIIPIAVSLREVEFTSNGVEFVLTVTPSDPLFEELFPTDEEKLGALRSLFTTRIEMLRRCPVTALEPIINP